MIALNERHVCGIVSTYARYYNRARTHLALEKDAPQSRCIQARDLGRAINWRGSRGPFKGRRDSIVSVVSRLAFRNAERFQGEFVLAKHSDILLTPSGRQRAGRRPA